MRFPVYFKTILKKMKNRMIINELKIRYDEKIH